MALLFYVVFYRVFVNKAFPELKAPDLFRGWIDIAFTISHARTAFLDFHILHLVGHSLGSRLGLMLGSTSWRTTLLLRLRALLLLARG